MYIHIRMGQQDTDLNMYIHIRMGQQDTDLNMYIYIRMGQQDTDLNMYIHIRMGQQDTDLNMYIHIRMGQQDPFIGVSLAYLQSDQKASDGQNDTTFCCISKHWMTLLRNASNPGPLFQYDYICKHGGGWRGCLSGILYISAANACVYMFYIYSNPAHS